MQVAMSAFVALILAGGSVPALLPGDDGSGPSLTLPGGPTIPLPPGAEVFGPQGPDLGLVPTLPGGPTTPETAPEPPKATLTPDQQRRNTVDELFDRLAKAHSETEADALLSRLDHIWLASGSPTADILMSRAIEAVGTNDYTIADDLLARITVMKPGWAEAWNKRATVHFLEGNDVASMEDISHVLRLEPRHFGALSGMGYILHRNGDDKDALVVFRRASAVNPQNKDVKNFIDTLTPEVEGHDL